MPRAAGFFWPVVLVLCLAPWRNVSAEEPVSPTTSEEASAAPAVEPEPYRAGEIVDRELEEPSDAYGEENEAAQERASAEVRYLLQRVRIVGNQRTKSHVVLSFVSFKRGEFINPEDPRLNALRWRLMGTGWFDRVELRFRKGQERGWVVLEIHVHERNTVIVENIVLGVSEGISEGGKKEPVSPYFGLSLVETNLTGRGIRLGGTVLAARRQQGFRISLTHPRRLRDKFAIRVDGFFNNAHEFFGNEPLVSTNCSGTSCSGSLAVSSAVVHYRRGGFMLGTGRDLSSSLRFTTDWQAEFVNVLSKPDAASERRGNEIRPINFGILDDRSFVSSLSFRIIYDTRDDPAISTRGTLLVGDMRAATRLLGSDYDFLKFQAVYRKWFPVGKGQTLRLGAYAGVILGDSPFFYQFHVSDLTDLIPSRVLEMQLDRRAPPNLLNTSIEALRTEELAARLDLTYEFPIYRRTRATYHRRLTAFITLGAYTLVDTQGSKLSIDGYEGLSRVPIDLTFDLGMRLDTRIGVFQIAISNLIGFVPL